MIHLGELIKTGGANINVIKNKIKFSPQTLLAIKKT